MISINASTYPYIFFAVALLLIVMIIIIVLLLVAHLRLKKRIDHFMGSRSEKYNMEAMLLDYLAKVNSVNDKYGELKSHVDVIDDRLRQCIQKVALIRYNPFNEMGGDLSFVLALLDENNSGVILNTIHGRDASYTYAKPVVSMESIYNLSEEEQNVLKMAAEQ